MKIGLIREGKVPPDKRVPFTPQQAEEIQQRFPAVKMCVQSSASRCFSDEEYRVLDIEVKEHADDCDILMGIKEVPVQALVARKTYLFFSHTIKKQPYNRKLLQAVLQQKIKLIDYEVLTDKLGNRLVAFGRYAGIVGAYNALWTYGKRYNRYTLRRAFECFDINDLKRELRKVQLPPVKIILTGAGRVGKGAMETLDTAGIRKVSPYDFLAKSFDEPVYVQLGSVDYHMRKEGGHFNREEFHRNPERYTSTFLPYCQAADVLMAGAFWNPKAPVLFSREDMLSRDFKVKIIADITCDIEGSIPSTKKASSISEPLYDYNPSSDTVEPPLSGNHHITVMAVDNLPCELPRSASEEFGHDLVDKVIPLLVGADQDDIIQRATIAEDGKLTERFAYLADYIATPG